MSQDRIVIALAAPDPGRNEDLLLRARRRGFRKFAAPVGTTAQPEPGETWYRSEPDGFQEATPSPRRVPLSTIREPRELEPVVSALQQGEPVAVRWAAERVIPLETLVAARRRPGTLWVVTDTPSAVPAYFGALEHGADTVVVEVADPGTLEDLEHWLEQVAVAVPWGKIPIRRVVPAGTGDRVIVDTTSLLAPEEGLLVGSSAALLFHVASEAVGSRYTRPRPFRVNAGAAHSYTLLANGDTRYLSELAPGDSVLACTPNGSSRAVRVGRLKIERRPLVQVEGERDHRRFTVFLQEAETVRLSTESGPVAITDLPPGTLVWSATLTPARHLGRAVEETIEER